MAATSRIRANVSWNADEAVRGLLCALPGAVVAGVWDVGLGCALALGTIVVALVGVPPAGARRASVFVAGIAFALAYGIGAILVEWPPVALLGVAVVAFGGALVARRGPLGRIAGSLVAPALALGMNHPAPEGLQLATTFAIGSAWATLVTVAWPERPPISLRLPAATDDPVGEQLYGLMYALAGTIGLAIGFALEVVHVAWAAGAALLIMRPVPDLTLSRAIGRVVATFVGITVAVIVAALDPSNFGFAVITAVAVAAVVGTRGSNWYVSPAGIGLVVLLMSSLSGPDALAMSYRERLVETAIGGGLALLFGVLIPTLARSRETTAKG